MSRFFATRWQVALVVGLFLGSLGVLLFNVFATLDLPRQELVARPQALGALAAGGSRGVLEYRPFSSPLTLPQSSSAKRL